MRPAVTWAVSIRRLIDRHSRRGEGLLPLQWKYLHVYSYSKNMTQSVVESLRRQIASCEAQLVSLRQELAEAELLAEQQRLQADAARHNNAADEAPLQGMAHDMSFGVPSSFQSEVLAILSQPQQQQPPVSRWPLSSTEYKRYGRQLIMPEIGLQGTQFHCFRKPRGYYIPMNELLILSRPTPLEECIRPDCRGGRSGLSSSGISGWSWSRHCRTY